MADLLPTISRAPHSYRRDGSVPLFLDDKPLIVFDGYCGLCSRVVQFALRHDRDARLRFLQAQSDLGDALYRHYSLDATTYETFILLNDGVAHFASDAALELANILGYPWRIAAILRVLPRAVRDAVYFFIARNRMRFFGRSETCLLPPAGRSDRFLTGLHLKPKSRQA
jgi:predicted DCC family thiol-disulfide oxidoreductase YuxK